MEESFILPQPLIKVEEFSDIIDLDFHKTSEDIIDEWHAKICMKFKLDIIADSERSLDSLMKWYIQCLKDDASSFENHDRLKLALMMHLQFFKLCFVELNCCFADNYLDNMEEILAFYLELEMKSVKKNSPDINRKTAYKRHISKFCHRIIATVKLYLLGREDRMYHVIMKMRTIELSSEAKDLFNLFCGKILTAQPSNKSDLAFCRAYILYQKWKEIRNPEERAKMDEIMYRVYDRTPESVKTNELLRQILLPQQDSLIQVLAHFHGNLINITEEYFKFFRSFSFQDECAVLPENMTNMDLLDHETNWGEDEEFNKAYENYLMSMTNVSSEQDDEDDCQFVSVTTRGPTDDNDVEIVHLIEDDDDISEVIVFNKKESFLDSIDILDGEKIISTPVQPVTVNNVRLNYTPSMKCDAPVLISSTISTNPASTISTNPANTISTKPASTIATKQASTISTIPASTISINPEEQRHEVEDSDIIEIRTNDSPTNRASESTAHMPEPPVPLAAKSVETQTENFVGSVHNYVEHDSIFNRFDGLVTPPSDQHSDDHDVRARHSSNIYAKFVQPPAPSSQNERVPSAETESGDQCSTHELALRDLLSPLLTETEKELDNIPRFQFDQDINSQSPLDNLNQTSANNVCNKADPHQKQNANETPPKPDSNEFSEGSLGNEAENVPTNILVSDDVSLPASECMEAPAVSVDRSSNVSSSQVSEVLYSSPDISSTSVDNFVENSLAMDVGTEEHRSSESVVAVEKSVSNAQDCNSNRAAEVIREENVHNESVSQSNLEDITGSVEDPVVTTVEEPHSETVSTNRDAAKADELNVLNDLSVSAVTEPTKNLNGDEQNATKSEKIMFTVQKAARKEFLNDFSTFEETIHRRWNILKEAHNLEDVLTGPVAKIDRLNGCLNPDKNFDLFDNRTVSPVPPTSSSVEVMSPTFEDGLDDFRNFYEEKKKNSVLAVSSSTCSDLDGNIKRSADKEGKLSVSTHLFPKKTSSLIKCDGSTVKGKETPKNQKSTVRKKRIAFAENVIETEPPITHSPTEIPVKTLQGILKKYPRENCENNHRNGTKKTKQTKRRIPKKLMNLKSLDHYKISPDDPRFQSGLCVVLDKNKVSQWLKIKELSQQFKEQKKRKEREILMMDCLTGTTTRITMNDIFRKETALPISNFDIPPQWRNNASRLKYNNREEGSSSTDLAYKDKKNGKRKRIDNSSSDPQQPKKRGRPRTKR